MIDIMDVYFHKKEKEKEANNKWQELMEIAQQSVQQELPIQKIPQKQKQSLSIMFQKQKIYISSIISQDGRAQLVILQQQFKLSLDGWDYYLDAAKNYFKILGRKVTRNPNDDWSWYQITCIRPLQKAACTFLNFKTYYGKDGHAIKFGIVTQNKKSSKNSNGNQTAYYYTWKYDNYGQMLIDGVVVEKKNTNLLVADGRQLQMQVDLIDFTISFNNSKRKVTHRLKKDHWKTKPVYVCVWMMQQEASAEITR